MCSLEAACKSPPPLTRSPITTAEATGAQGYKSTWERRPSIHAYIPMQRLAGTSGRLGQGPVAKDMGSTGVGVPHDCYPKVP